MRLLRAAGIALALVSAAAACGALERARAGHWEEREVRTWVPGHYEKVWVPSEYRTIYPNGRAVTIRVRGGHWKVVWVPGHWRVERVRVWVETRARTVPPAEAPPQSMFCGSTYADFVNSA